MLDTNVFWMRNLMKKSPLGNNSSAMLLGTFSMPLSSIFSKNAFMDKNPVIGRKIVLNKMKKKFHQRIDLSLELFFLKSSKSTIYSIINGTSIKLNIKKIKGEKYAVTIGTKYSSPISLLDDAAVTTFQIGVSLSSNVNGVTTTIQSTNRSIDRNIDFIQLSVLS